MIRLAVAALLAMTLMPQMVGVAGATGELEPRSVTQSTSAAGGGATVTDTITFTLATSGQTLGSIKFEMCDSPVSGTSCANTGNSANSSFTGASFGSVTCAACNGGAWSLGSASGNSAYITHTAAAVTGTPSITVVLNNVTNPTTSNVEYYFRISTYSDTAATTPAYPGTDYGAVALDTANQIVVSGTMPESLVFCVGTSGTDCTNITGTTVNLGTFSPTTTSTGTSVMDVSTNAGSGYAISINGTTLQSGLNSITAMGTQTLNSAACSPSCTSTTGTSQFGSNVVANTTPAVGAGVNPTGSGYNGAGFGGYNTANSFRFFNGDTVASSSQVSNAQLFTNSYIVNVPGSQAAGVYTSTLTYICTATF